MLKKMRHAVMASLWLLIFSSESAQATFEIATSSSEISIDFSLPKPHFSPTQGGESFVTLEGLENTIDSASPSVPFQTYRLALPQGAVVREALLELAQVDEYKTTLAFPTQMRPLSRMLPGKLYTEESQPQSFRDSSQRLEFSTQRLHGTSIVLLNFYPVENAPGSEITKVIRSGRLRLVLESDANALHPTPTFYPHQLEELRDLVDNPQVLPSAESSSSLLPSYDYLILANSAIIGLQGENNLSALVSNLESRGLKARIADVSQAVSNASGNDKAAKIRSYIRNEYQTNGIRFVLLVGDDDTRGGSSTIPARKMQGNIRAYDGTSWKQLREDISADLYYGCLDGDFDGNGNKVWGELDDGVGGGDIDLLCEVTVGRVTAEKPADLSNFVRKTIFAATEKLPRTTLLMGEELFAEKGLYGSEYMNQLVGHVVDHGYETNGFPTTWSIDRLYDTKSTAWRGADAVKALSSSKYLFVNHLGHSNEFFNMRILGADVEQIGNSLPFFLYSQGCLASRFTVNDSIHELMLRSPNAAFAIIGNTTYGLVPEDPSPGQTKTPGASQMLHRGFVDLFNASPEMALGKVHQLSKQRFMGYAAVPEMRWVFWAANFFGDPSLVLHF